MRSNTRNCRISSTVGTKGTQKKFFTPEVRETNPSWCTFKNRCFVTQKTRHFQRTILLESHAHSDHVAGHALIKQLTGARVEVMEGDSNVVSSGGKG